MAQPVKPARAKKPVLTEPPENSYEDVNDKANYYEPVAVVRPKHTALDASKSVPSTTSDSQNVDDDLPEERAGSRSSLEAIKKNSVQQKTVIFGGQESVTSPEPQPRRHMSEGGASPVFSLVAGKKVTGSSPKTDTGISGSPQYSKPQRPPQPQQISTLKPRPSGPKPGIQPRKLSDAGIDSPSKNSESVQPPQQYNSVLNELKAKDVDPSNLKAQVSNSPSPSTGEGSGTEEVISVSARASMFTSPSSSQGPVKPQIKRPPPPKFTPPKDPKIHMKSEPRVPSPLSSEKANKDCVKCTASETKSEKAPNTSSSDTIKPELPQYAKVDWSKKSSKKKPQAPLYLPPEDKPAPSAKPETIPPKVGDSQQSHDAAEGDDDKSASSESSRSPASKPAPPLKPPRTFAHDEYMKTKEIRKLTKVKSERTNPKQSLLMKGNMYEDISEVREEVRRGGSPVGEATEGTIKPLSINTHLEPGDSEPGRMRSSSSPGRPAPPPRPPPPSPQPRDAAEEPKKSPAFIKNPAVHIKQHNTRLNKDAFIKQHAMRNPGYDKQEYVLNLRRPRLARSNSDEMLYSEPRDLSRTSDEWRTQISIDPEPIYHEPSDFITSNHRSSVSPHGVALDCKGYAVPESRHHTQIKRPKPPNFNKLRAGTLSYHPHQRPQLDQRPIGKSGNIKNILNQKKRPAVQEKLSRAYSVLRLGIDTGDGMATDDANNTETEDDSETEVDMEDHRKRLEYVSTVKLRAYTTQGSQQDRLQKTMTSQRLFTYGLIVGLKKVQDKNTYEPEVLFHFPEQVPSLMLTISEFCFPDAHVWRPVTHYNAETFSFVLTNADGSRKYGYCRRALPAGSGNRLPLVFCIVTPHDLPNFYAALLSRMEELHANSADHAEELLQAAYGKPLPPPGGEAWVRCTGADNKKDTLFLRRQKSARAEKVSYEALLTHLSVDLLLRVFGAVLLERRVIFLAQHLSTLTSCVQAMVSLLYPFTWQHTFVPVLPASMVDVCDAPTPYVMGVLTSLQPQLANICMDEILMVDLDNGTLLHSQGDEGRIIPKKLQKALKAALKDDGDGAVPRDLIVSEAFLRLFVETAGHYSDYMCTQMDGEAIFEKKAFITSVSSHSIRMFLEWFTETQLFEMYITSRMYGINPSCYDLFETRITEYREEMTEVTSLKQNMRAVGRKMKKFFVASGDKLKRKFNHNVFV